MEMLINSLQATIVSMEVPNLSAMQKLGQCGEKLGKTLCWKGKQANMNFEQITQERFDFFIKCISLALNTTDEVSKCSI